MKKRIAVALCGILLFTVLLPGCGSAGAQAGDQDMPEQVSDVKPQDEAEEQEKLSTAKDGQPDVETDAAADKAAKDSASVKTDTAKTQEDKADSKTVDSGSGAGSAPSESSKADNSSGNTSGGNSAGNTSSGSNSSESGTSSSSADTGNISNGAGTSQPEHSHSEHAQPEHTHSWVEQTTTVTHEATGHYETVVVKEAWDEPVYEMKELSICNVCGKVIEGDPAYHGKEHALAGEGAGHHSEWTQVQTGTIHHEAVTEQVWVEDSPAWTETVRTGNYICSTCGAAK